MLKENTAEFVLLLLTQSPIEISSGLMKYILLATSKRAKILEDFRENLYQIQV